MGNQKHISVAAPLIGAKEKEYVNQALDSTWISSKGPFLERFEEMVASLCNVDHAIACNNGTTSLHLALVGLGLEPSDEVIIPSLTYIATANVIKYCGGIPVLVDNDPFTMNIDPDSIEAAITPKTRGIIVVHLYGQSADMDRINEIAQQHNIWVIEDAAEAHGARYKGQVVGGISNCGSFSFFGNKIVTTGEGGALTTNDAKLAEKLRLYRNQGMDPNRRYWHPVIGYNYRMTNVTAAIGVAQMERLDLALKKRKELARKYDERLAQLDEYVDRPHVADYNEHSFWMYTILLRDHIASSRDDIIIGMEEQGIETRPLFYPLHFMPPYRDPNLVLPNAESCSRRGLNLPTHELLTENDLDRIVDSLAKLVGI